MKKTNIILPDNIVKKDIKAKVLSKISEFTASTPVGNDKKVKKAAKEVAKHLTKVINRAVKDAYKAKKKKAKKSAGPGAKKKKTVKKSPLIAGKAAVAVAKVSAKRVNKSAAAEKATHS